jgi:hypothetical protein
MTIAALIDFAVRTSHDGQRRYWTREEESFLRRNLGRMTFRQIGVRLGRSENAVKIKQVRRQIPVPSKRPGFYTGNQVARILCVDIHCIILLHKRGLLKFAVLAGERRILQISQVSLWVWAINPMNWIYFKPHRVRDQRLRRLIELRQAMWDDEWWTPGQVARFYGLVTSNTVNQAIRRGQLPATRWGNWWIKRSDALNRPFYPGKGRSTGKDHWPPRADAFILRARDELRLPYAVIGRMMKWPEKRVMYRYYTLKGKTNAGIR